MKKVMMKVLAVRGLVTDSKWSGVRIKQANAGYATNCPREGS